MIEQITKGIKISVETTYNGTSLRNDTLYYVFSYTISIENRSLETVKLTDIVFFGLPNTTGSCWIVTTIKCIKLVCMDWYRMPSLI